MQRRRYFHISTRPGAKKISAVAAPKVSAHPGANVKPPIDAHTLISPHGKTYVSRAGLIDAFGLSCVPEKRLRNLTKDGIEQGIPPRFTKWIAEYMLREKFTIG
jgi:hypothetical protein